VGQQGVWVGCAGWTLPREGVAEFPGSQVRRLRRESETTPSVGAAPTA
jgi:hypothetical protein